jgi:hypothetical protein
VIPLRLVLLVSVALAAQGCADGGGESGGGGGSSKPPGFVSRDDLGKVIDLERRLQDARTGAEVISLRS